MFPLLITITQPRLTRWLDGLLSSPSPLGYLPFPCSLGLVPQPHCYSRHLASFAHSQHYTLQSFLASPPLHSPTHLQHSLAHTPSDTLDTHPPTLTPIIPPPPAPRLTVENPTRPRPSSPGTTYASLVPSGGAEDGQALPVRSLFCSPSGALPQHTYCPSCSGY